MNTTNVDPTREIKKVAVTSLALPAYQIDEQLRPLMLDGKVKDENPYIITRYKAVGGLRWWQKAILFPLLATTGVSFVAFLLGHQWMIGEYPVVAVTFVAYIVLATLTLPFADERELAEEQELTHLGAYRVALFGEEYDVNN